MGAGRASNCSTLARLSPGLAENVKESVKAATFIRVHWRYPRDLRWEGLRDAKRIHEKAKPDAPARRFKTAQRRAGCSASKRSTGFCSPRNRAVTEVVAWAAGNGNAMTTPTIDTASNVCGRSVDGFFMAQKLPWSA